MKRDLLACLPLAIAAALGAWQAFPVYDDGYYLLLLREGGPAAFPSAHLDRPLYGWLLAGAARTLGESASLLALFSAALWLWLALLTGQLWRATFPASTAFSPLAAAGVLAPVWAQIQISTVTVVLPCVLPVALVLAGVLSLAQGRLVRGLAAVVAGALLGEYRIGAALACAPWLYDRLPKRTLLAAAIAAALAFGTFLATRRTEGVRTDVTLRHAAANLYGLPAEAPLRFARGVARVVFGAPLGAFAASGPPAERPKAAAAAWVFAAVVAAALWTACSPHIGGALIVTQFHTLAMGLAAALLPVVAFGRDPAESGFGSRFLLPALPLAAALFPALLLRFLRPPAHRPAAALAGFAFGLAAIQVALGAADHRRVMARLGRDLHALTRESAGSIMAIVDAGEGARWAPGSPYMLTAQAELALPLKQRGRLWLVPSSAGLSGCPSALHWEGRGILRHSAVARCFSARIQPSGAVSIDPLTIESKQGDMIR